MAIYAQENILPGTIVINKIPVNLSDEEKFLFENDLVKKLPQVNLYHFKNISVTPHGILFSGFHIYKQFLIWKKHAREFNFFYLLRNYLKRKKRTTNQDTIYLICFDYWSMGYFHWMCDFLPKLVLLEEHLQNCTLLLPASHNYPYVQDALKAFGIKNILQFSDNEYVSCKTALVPGYVTLSGDNNPAVMLRLRDKLFNYYAPKEDASKYPQNIYVSRARAKGRFIVNEEEVITLLRSYHFKIVYFEDHSFSEQLNLAFNCKNMVGLHGANLTNLIFMKPQSTVMELRAKGDQVKNYYFSLASSFNLHYFYLQCRPVSENETGTPDFYVDVNALTQQMKNMLAY